MDKNINTLNIYNKRNVKGGLLVNFRAIGKPPWHDLSLGDLPYLHNFFKPLYNYTYDKHEKVVR